MENIQELWDKAKANPGEKVLIGSLVVCDICDKDWTNETAKGGFIFGSKAYCPDCAKRGMASIIRYGEQRYIKAECPAETSFADFVRQYRGEDAYISITEL